MLGRRFFFPSIHSLQKTAITKNHITSAYCVLRLVEKNQPKYKQVIKPLQIIALSVNKSPVSVAFHPVGFALLFVCVCIIELLLPKASTTWHWQVPNSLHCLFNGLAFFPCTFLLSYCLFVKHFLGTSFRFGWQEKHLLWWSSRICPMPIVWSIAQSCLVYKMENRNKPN